MAETAETKYTTSFAFFEALWDAGVRYVFGISAVYHAQPHGRDHY